MREGDPGSIHPDDMRDTPDKNVKEIDELRINESGYGRYSSQKPDTENLDQQDFQIDEETRKMRDRQAEEGEDL